MTYQQRIGRLMLTIVCKEIYQLLLSNAKFAFMFYRSYSIKECFERIYTSKYSDLILLFSEKSYLTHGLYRKGYYNSESNWVWV